MKRSKILFISILLIAVSLCLFSCFSFNKKQKDPYTAYEISKADIVQKAANRFQFTLTSDITPSDTAKVYITRYDRIDSDTESIEYENVDGKFRFLADVSYSSYFIHIVDGDKLATLPMTRPQMAPSLAGNESSTVLTYNFVNGTSWSSFCDPTGKSVYKSSSSTFDENAELVASNVNIFGVDSTTDIKPSNDKPYYYVVLSAKNGIVTYVSAPLLTVENAYSDIRVSMENVNGTPMLKVSGKFVCDGDVALEFYSADSKLGRVMETVGDYVTGKAGDTFEVSLDMNSVVNGSTGAGIWYDIKLATSSGNLYEISSDNADMSESLKSKNVFFEFKEWKSILKLNYQYREYDISSVRIETINGVPTLVVEGEFYDGLRDAKLHADISAGEKTTERYWETLSEEQGKLLFRVPLTEIPTDGQPWAWFHICTYRGQASVYSSKDELVRGDGLTIGQEFVYNGVTYTIKAYNNTGSQLAIEARAN